MEAPPIDRRSFSQLVAQTEELLQRYSAWRPAADGQDPGKALVRIFARLAEVVIDRLNQVPDKNFLAFLDLVGVELHPPHAARVPLTFQLAAGSTSDALVPSGTRVAAIPVEGETEPVIFETERDLTVTKSQLAFAFTREPGRDLYSDHTARVAGAGDRAFSVFDGELPIGHRFYIGHSNLFGLEAPKTITLRLSPADGGESWLRAVKWSYWDGKEAIPLEADGPNKVEGAWELALANVPGIRFAEVGGKKSVWLYGQLETSLPWGELIAVGPASARTDLRQSYLLPDTGFSDGIPLSFDLTFYPFGQTTPRSVFYLACDAAFSKPGAQVTLDVDLDATRPARPSSTLVLVWDYYDGNQWRAVGRSSPGSTSMSQSSDGFTDGTQAFTRDGQVKLRCPADWTTFPVNGLAHFWLRVSVDGGDYGQGTDFQPPAVQRLAVRYEWPLPRIDTLQARVDINRYGLLPDLAFTNQLPVDLTKDFFPFGEKPKFNDTMYLTSDEAFARPSAMVTLNVALNNPRRHQAAWPLPTVNPSDDIAIAWEYWNGSKWASLGQGTHLPGEFLLEPFRTPVQAETLTLRGQVSPGAVIKGEEITVNAAGEPTTVSIEVTVKDETWEAVINNLSNGLHAFRITEQIQKKTRLNRWAVALCLAPGVDSADLEAAAPPITIAQAVVIRGRTEIKEGQVVVINAAPDKPKPWIGKIQNNRFKLEVDVQQGRNDLLALVFDEKDKENPVAGDVVTVVKYASPAQNDFQDGTWGFTRSGPVSFRCPGDAARGVVNGQPGFWVRARLASGNYGVEAHYEPVTDPQTGEVIINSNTGLPIYQLVLATFKPPSVRTIHLGYQYSSPLTPPDYTLTENDFVIMDRSQEAKTGGKLFNPFTHTLDSRPTFYLGFQRQGAETGFANRSIALHFSVAEALYGHPVGDGQAGAEPPVVAWEYWNGSTWVRLGTRDETKSFVQRGIVTFIGPADFRSSTEFGLPAFWLRGRWERGAYASPPRLRRVLTNTIWATQALTIQNEILGSSTGEREQVFRFSKTPVVPGQRVEVREPELPSLAEREAIEAQEGKDVITTVKDATGRPVEIWVRWHEVPDFFHSASRSRHYTLDRLKGEIRFGDGIRGLIPSQGRANVRAVWYQAGGGPQGNRPPGNITQLKSAVPYVAGVTNLEPARGGSAPETLEAVRIRGPKTLRHRNRAVAITDFEDLSFEASTDVARVKGIPAQDSWDAGRVELIIVPRSADPQPIPSLELLGRVKEAIEAGLTPTADLWVAGPDWLRVSVTGEIVPVSPEAATDVQTAVLARLAAFLHPLTGGLDSQGWAFGRKPYRSDLYALIESIPGVDHVHRLAVDMAPDDGLLNPDRFLVYSGDHEITMVSGSGAEDAAALAQF